MQPLVTLTGAWCSQGLFVPGHGVNVYRHEMQQGVKDGGSLWITGKKRGSNWCVRDVHGKTCFGWNSRFNIRRSLNVSCTAGIEGDVVQELIISGEEPVAEELAAVEPTSDESDVPTAKVKFVLEKECHYGQQFSVVGSSAQLGEWDPAQGIRLDWSEGHIWSKEVAIAVGQMIEYKFVLSGKRGELEWQPGANLVLETKDSSDLVLNEPWGSSLPALEISDGTGEVEPTVKDDTSSTPSSNGVATESKLSKEVISAVAEAAEGDDTVSSGLKSLVGKENGQPAAEEASAEVPVVDAALASVVEEVSGDKVEDPAAAEV